jgi:hypothetical protein
LFLRIEFTSHALAKLGIVGVTKEMVERGLSNLSEVFRDSEKSLFVGTSKLRDGILVWSTEVTERFPERMIKLR